ncbi:hypothetical protein COD17_08785 [Bacillus thuringiensis]|nr:hypothetical protein COD17_08785 [Bacillus thuringiensis]
MFLVTAVYMQINFDKKPMVTATTDELKLFCEKGKTLKDLGKFVAEVTSMARKFPTVFVQELNVVQDNVTYLIKLTKLDVPSMTRVVLHNTENNASEFLDIPTDSEIDWARSIISLMEVSKIRG